MQSWSCSEFDKRWKILITCHPIFNVGVFRVYVRMVFGIISVIVLSFMIVTMYVRECKRKNEILPILSVLVFIFR